MYRIVIVWMVFFLLAINASAGSSLDNELWEGVLSGDEERVKKALSSGAYVDAPRPASIFQDSKDHSPLMVALGTGMIPVARMLLGEGANPLHESDGLSPIHFAVGGGEDEIFISLADHGVDYSQEFVRDDITLIDLAAMGGSVTILKKLLEAGHRLPEASEEQNRLFSMLVSYSEMSPSGGVEMFRFLLEAMEDTLSREKREKFAWFALERGSAPLVLYLHGEGILTGAEVNRLVLARAFELGLTEVAGDLISSPLIKEFLPEDRFFTTYVTRYDFLETARLLIAAGGADFVRPSLNAMIRTAVFRGDDELLRQVLALFDDISDAEGMILAFSIEAERWDLARSLLRDPEVKIVFSDEEDRFLERAVEKGPLEVVELLLARGVVPGYRSGVILNAACERDSTDILAALLRGGADPNSEFRPWPLECAIRRENPAMIHLLLEHGADPNVSPGWFQPSFFDRVIAQGDPELVGPFLIEGAREGLSRATLERAFVEALSVGNIDLIDLFVEAGFDPNEEIYSPSAGMSLPPVLLAAAAEKPLVIARLIERGAQIPPKGWTGQETLCNAVWSVPEVFQIFLKGVPEIDDVCEEGPLMAYAAASGYMGVVDLLLSRGADIDQQITHGEMAGWTPLMIAVDREDIEMVAHLLGRGASPERPEAGGEGRRALPAPTPLLLAIESNQIDMLYALAAGGADLEKQTWAGVTPLMVAVRGQHIEAVRHLLRLGADPCSRDSEGNRFFTRVSGSEILKIMEEGARKCSE